MSTHWPFSLTMALTSIWETYSDEMHYTSAVCLGHFQVYNFYYKAPFQWMQSIRTSTQVSTWLLVVVISNANINAVNDQNQTPYVLQTEQPRQSMRRYDPKIDSLSMGSTRKETSTVRFTDDGSLKSPNSLIDCMAVDADSSEDSRVESRNSYPIDIISDAIWGFTGMVMDLVDVHNARSNHSTRAIQW